MSVQWCQLGNTYSHSLNPYIANTCETLKDCSRNAVPLDSLPNEAAATTFPSFLGSNSITDHGHQLVEALTKRNTPHHSHKHQKKPAGRPPRDLYIAIVVPIVLVTILIGAIYLYFSRRKTRQQQKKSLEQLEQQHQQEDNQIAAMEMDTLEPREDLRDNTMSPTAKEMGALSSHASASSSTFNQPRPAPYPPPASPPPNRPLPPTPVRKAKNPPVVAEGHGGEDELDMLPQWHLIYDLEETSSSGSKA
ncbi:hypothetical protein F5Y08DRAFT_339900 [Xylaria arbuscula]|nr:hypothetical protein F5Y08DRAFT_339900 [Xylaria arbuscula]